MSKNYSEEELFEKSRELYKEGYKIFFIYKYLKRRTDDSELISKIIDSLKSNKDYNLERENRIEEKNKEINYLIGNSPYFDMLMGVILTFFGLIFSIALYENGFISRISIAVFVVGIVMLIRGIRNLKA